MSVPLPALEGLIDQLNHGAPVTPQRRAAFMVAVSAILDFVYPDSRGTPVLGTIDEPAALGSGDDTDDEGDDEGDGDGTVVAASGYVKWFEVMRSLASGEIDEFACEKRTSSVAGLRSELYRKYPGCVVNFKDHGNGMTTVKVRVGAYGG